MFELPYYRCHKVVRAVKIRSVVRNDDGTAFISADSEDKFKVDDEYVRKHRPRAGGYYVVYDDGYKSWSPADAFERGYTLMTAQEASQYTLFTAQLRNLRRDLSAALDRHLAEKPYYDNSIVGFSEAWKIMLEVFEGRGITLDSGETEPPPEART